MPNPHDKSPTLVTRIGHVLLPMHERFLCVVKCASQLRILPDPDTFTVDRGRDAPEDLLREINYGEVVVSSRGSCQQS